MAVDVARFLACRFNRSTLYMGIHADKEERNHRIIQLREKKNLTFEQIAKTLGLSVSTVHSVVMNKGTVTINGDFGQSRPANLGVKSRC